MTLHVLAHDGGAEQRIVDHLATLIQPGGALYVLDAHVRRFAMYSERAGLEDLFDRYLEFLAATGSDLRIGLRLSHLIKTAELLVEDFRGWIPIIEVTSREPTWAAREAMLAAGAIDKDDIERWEKAFRTLEAAAERPLLFPAASAALGRRPADQS